VFIFLKKYNLEQRETRNASYRKDYEAESVGGAKFMFRLNNKLCRAGLKWHIGDKPTPFLGLWPTLI